MHPTSPPADSPERRVAWRPIAIALAVAVLLGVLGLWLYARGGGPVPPFLSGLSPKAADVLAPSSPDERVLRVLRLAGVERAVVGQSAGVAVVRVELPSVRTVADAEFAWQAGFSAMVGSYPKAGRYVVQLFGPDASPLVEMGGAGEAVRAAVKSDDAVSLRKAVSARYLSEQGGGQ